MAVSKRLRFEILRRDNHTCRYCGESAPGVKLVVDHVIPEVLGGKTEPSNLVAACEPCNSGKSSVAPDSPMVADVLQDALRWARAMEICRRGDQVERDQRDSRRLSFLHQWESWTYNQTPIDLPVDWPETVDTFLRCGLDEEDLQEAVDVAMRRRGISRQERFRYFCGVSWKMLRDRQEQARTLAPFVGFDEPPQPGDSNNPWSL